MKIHVGHKTGSPVDVVASECCQIDEIASLKREMGAVNKAVFIGNGRPGLVSQMATNSQAIGALTRLAWVTLTAVIGEAVLLVFRLFTGVGVSEAQEKALNALASEVQALNRAVAVREMKKGGE